MSAIVTERFRSLVMATCCFAGRKRARSPLKDGRLVAILLTAIVVFIEAIRADLLPIKNHTHNFGIHVAEAAQRIL